MSLNFEEPLSDFILWRKYFLNGRGP